MGAWCSLPRVPPLLALPPRLNLPGGCGMDSYSYLRHKHKIHSFYYKTGPTYAKVCPLIKKKKKKIKQQDGPIIQNVGLQEYTGLLRKQSKKNTTWPSLNEFMSKLIKRYCRKTKTEKSYYKYYLGTKTEKSYYREYDNSTIGRCSTNVHLVTAVNTMQSALKFLKVTRFVFCYTLHQWMMLDISHIL